MKIISHSPLSTVKIHENSRIAMEWMVGTEKGGEPPSPFAEAGTSFWLWGSGVLSEWRGKQTNTEPLKTPSFKQLSEYCVIYTCICFVGVTAVDFKVTLDSGHRTGSNCANTDVLVKYDFWKKLSDLGCCAWKLQINSTSFNSGLSFSREDRRGARLEEGWKGMPYETPGRTVQPDRQVSWFQLLELQLAC